LEDPPPWRDCGWRYRLGSMVPKRREKTMSDERILVVDDYALLVQVCTEILAEAGYRVCTACGGREALAWLGAEPFDLRLLDLKMPGMDGLTVLRQGRELHPALVAIVITSYATPENAIAALRVGAQGVLSKPFDPDELLEAVRKALATHHQEQAVLEDRAVRQ
jgi:two-component system response regulator PilR (NtrC family)